MSIIEFNRVTIQREEIREGVGRFYTVQQFDGSSVIVPSVTTILGNTRDNSFLEQWAKNNPGAKEAAAARGTKVHNSIETWFKTKEEPTDPETLLYFPPVLPVLRKITPLAIETPIFHRAYKFAGRVDAVGLYRMGDADIPLLIDWKTSSKKKYSWYDYPYQLSAYYFALKENYPELVLAGALLCCMCPKEVQVEMYGEEQLRHYWEVFQRRALAFHSNYYVSPDSLEEDTARASIEDLPARQSRQAIFYSSHGA